MHVERYLRPAADWTPDPASGVRILARLRNHAPLAVEKRYGQGRVIAFLTTYAPYWNDLVLGPNVIVALRLQSYLGSARRITDVRTVSGAIQVPFSGERYRSDVRMFLPSDDPAAPLVIDRTAEALETDARQLVATIEPQETERSGIYEIWLRRIDGSTHAHRFAVNVEPREGNLAQTATSDIIAHLDPVPVDIGYADQYEAAVIEQSGFNQSMLLMALLVFLLVGEQWLAYANSFHAHRGTQLHHLGRPGHRASIQRLREENEAEARAAHALRDADPYTVAARSAASGADPQDPFAQGVPQ